MSKKIPSALDLAERGFVHPSAAIVLHDILAALYRDGPDTEWNSDMWQVIGGILDQAGLTYEHWSDEEYHRLPSCRPCGACKGRGSFPVHHIDATNDSGPVGVTPAERVITYARASVIRQRVRATIQAILLWRERATLDLELARAAGHESEVLYWRREYPRRLHVAINRKAGMPDERSRKWTAQYETDLMRDAQDLRMHFQLRVRIYQLRTPELRRRFQAHLTPPTDD